MAAHPRRPGRLPRWAEGRGQGRDLAPGEFLTRLSLMTPEGQWVNLGYALISPYHTSSWLSQRAADMLEYEQQDLTEEETHTFLTPDGNATSRQAVVLWFELSQLPLPPCLIRLPLLGRPTVGDLEVDMILGIPFLNCLPYVSSPSIVNVEAGPIWPGYEEEEELFQQQGDHNMAANQNMNINGYE
ncbi:hypothetical protein QBC38DRAFT_5150 [Podospora fimiseda]|uniref:Uncharacterized protein n=1 Tax=Podospora fimiseda TaxID=252190 RepID=A0AAN7BZM1_9PEZI|nr:hypothetical protein QBC38DRAFT_5150 [Podospora fimiseda]